jgi:hypothetical protein
MDPLDSKLNVSLLDSFLALHFSHSIPDSPFHFAHL